MTDGGDKKPERRTKTRTNDPVKIQKRPRENETEMEAKAARQNGMTDVSSPGASSSVLLSATNSLANFEATKGLAHVVRFLNLQVSKQQHLENDRMNYSNPARGESSAVPLQAGQSTSNS